MRLQSKAGFCGPAAVVNALRCLGRKVPEAQVAASAGCTSEGIGPDPLLETVRSLGYAATKFETPDRNAAWGWLVDSIGNGRPAIVLIMENGHYVTVTGLLGNSVNVYDSTNTQRNRAENGAHVFSKREFMKKWLCSSEGMYFGMSIGKK